MNNMNGYGFWGGGPGWPGFSAPDLKKAAEKRSVKRASNAIGGAFLIMTGGILVISLIVQLIVVYGLQKTSLLSDAGFLWIEQDVFSALGFTIPFAIAAKLMKFRLPDLFPLKKVRPSLLAPLVMISLGTFIIANYATSMIGSIFSAFGVSPAQQSIDIPDGVSGTVLYILSISFLPAFVEEFALRGVVMGSLRRFGDGFAVFVSAALFGLMHGNLVQVPFAFVAGLALGYIDIVAGSLWPSVVAHLLNNLFATIISDYSASWPSALNDFINLAYPLLMIILALIGVVMLLRQKPAAFRLPKAPTALRGAEKLRYFIATPCMIISIIYFAADMILTQILY